MTAKHEPFYPGVQQRAHTHQTRLDRNVQRGADQTVVPNMPSGLTQGLDLGVGSWVVERERGVMTATNEHLVADHHCPHRDLARGFGASRFLQSRGHPERVICHRGRSASYRRCRRDCGRSNRPLRIHSWGADGATVAAWRSSASVPTLPWPPAIRSTSKPSRSSAARSSRHQPGTWRGAPGVKRSLTNSSFSRGRYATSMPSACEFSTG